MHATGLSGTTAELPDDINFTGAKIMYFLKIAL